MGSALFALGFVGTGRVLVSAQSSVGGAGSSISCSSTESQLANGSTSLKAGNATLYIGYHQASSNNQNPVMARYDDGVRVWCRDDYETSGDDGRGYGIFWDGTVLYGVFSATGTQGSPDQDYRRFTGNGWLSSYGQGGGARVAVILRINPNTGEPDAGTFLTARLSNGNSNSITVKNLALSNQGTLIVNADSWFSPRNVDKSAMTCSGSSPFNYTIEFNADLTQALGASADGCTGNSPAPGAPGNEVLASAPANNSSITNAANWGHFQWMHDSDYTWYGIYIAKPNNAPPYYQWHPASTMCDGQVCTLDLHIELLSNGAYQWYIAGYSTAIGPWAGPLNFTVNMTQTTAAQNLNVAQVNGSALSITWAHQPGAAYYQVYLGTGDFQTVLHLDWHKSTPGLCNDGLCTLNLPAAPAGTYEAWVYTWGPAGFSIGGVQGWAGPAQITIGN